MKRIILFLFLIVLIPITVKADMGPKPTVKLNITGIEEPHYYVTLLSSVDHYGPWSVSNRSFHDGDEAIYNIFSEYQDEFYFLNYYQKCFGKDTFSWTYFPPETFKVLIYLPESDVFIESNTMERYAFNSSYNVQVKDNELIIKRNFAYGLELIKLFVRLLLTLGIELFIAWLFKIRKEAFTFILKVNVVSQILLNIFLNVILLNEGFFVFVFYYVLLELLVIIFEMGLYLTWHSKYKVLTPKKWVFVLFAIIANVTSFIIGTQISIFFEL